MEEADKDFPLGVTGGSSIVAALSSSKNPPFDPENRPCVVKKTHLRSREWVGLC